MSAALAALIFLVCPGEDLNLHALRHIHLKDACLPISTPGQVSAPLLNKARLL